MNFTASYSPRYWNRTHFWVTLSNSTIHVHHKNYYHIGNYYIEIGKETSLEISQFSPFLVQNAWKHLVEQCAVTPHVARLWELHWLTQTFRSHSPEEESFVGRDTNLEMKFSHDLKLAANKLPTFNLRSNGTHSTVGFTVSYRSLYCTAHINYRTWSDTVDRDRRHLEHVFSGRAQWLVEKDQNPRFSPFLEIDFWIIHI